MSNLDIVPIGMDVPGIARAFADSGMFKDAKGEAQAITKIIAGRSLGLDPFSSMSGLHVMQGKVEVGSHVIAGAIKRSARYDYRVREKSETACRIEFYENGDTIGVELYEMADAKRAQLTKNATWTKFPKAMLFARCISAGYRTYCPDVFSCPVYVEGEISAAPAPTVEHVNEDQRPDRVMKRAEIAHPPQKQIAADDAWAFGDDYILTAEDPLADEAQAVGCIASEATPWQVDLCHMAKNCAESGEPLAGRDRELAKHAYAWLTARMAGQQARLEAMLGLDEGAGVELAGLTGQKLTIEDREVIIDGLEMMLEERENAIKAAK